jgi:hypothetical protein
MAKRLRRANPVTGQRRSLRKIAEELAAAGHLNEKGAALQCNEHFPDAQKLRRGLNVVAVDQ